MFSRASQRSDVFSPVLIGSLRLNLFIVISDVSGLGQSFNRNSRRHTLCYSISFTLLIITAIKRVVWLVLSSHVYLFGQNVWY